MSTAATKITAKKEAEFLEALAESGNVSVACKAAVVTRGAIYKHRKSNPDFRAEWKDAVSRAIDVLEEEARRRAFSGVNEPVFHKGVVCGVVTKYSDVLLIFLLKGLRPKKYRDNWSGQLSGPNGGPIPLHAEASDMTDEQLQPIANRGITETRDSAAVAQQAHTPQVLGSTPNLATNEKEP